MTMSLHDYTITRIETAVLVVSNLDQGRGYTPKQLRDESKADFDKAAVGYRTAVQNGYLTPVSRGWGHRVTDKGKAVLAELVARRQAHEARLRSAGFDPNKPVAQMTPAEVEAFIAYQDSRKAG